MWALCVAGREYGLDPFEIVHRWTPRQLHMAIDAIGYRSAVEDWYYKQSEKKTHRNSGAQSTAKSTRSTRTTRIWDAFEEAEKAGLTKPYPWRWQINDDGTKTKIRVH